MLSFSDWFEIRGTRICDYILCVQYTEFNSSPPVMVQTVRSLRGHLSVHDVGERKKSNVEQYQ